MLPLLVELLQTRLGITSLWYTTASFKNITKTYTKPWPLPVLDLFTVYGSSLLFLKTSAILPILDRETLPTDAAHFALYPY